METYYKRYGTRNYLLYLVEGGAFIGAVGFINPQTLLPSLILEQNGPEWLAAFAPSLMVIGMFSIPILCFGLVERLARYYRFVIALGFLQRAIYLVAAALLLWAPLSPIQTVAVLAATPFLSGLFGGVALTAWQQLYMGAVPPKRRASNFAIRFLIGGVTGVIAGKTIELTLAENPGTEGYGLLHVYACLFFVFSFVALLAVKENPFFKVSAAMEPAHVPVKAGGFKETGSKVAAMLVSKELRLLWPVLFLMHFMFLITPFYAVGLRLRFEMDASFLGVLAFWQMLGSSMGNLTAGLVGDRIGGRRTFLWGILLFAVVILPGAHTENLGFAKLLYLAFGFFMMMSIIGKDTLIMEMAPDVDRSLYLAMAALVSMFGMLVSSLLSYFIWSHSHNLLMLAYPTAALFLVNAILLAAMANYDHPRLSPLKVVQRGIMRYFR
jgi:MFS family permease